MTTNGGTEAAWAAAVRVAEACPPRLRDVARLAPHERGTLGAIQARLRRADPTLPAHAGLSPHDCWALAYLILRCCGEDAAAARAALGLADGFLDAHFGWPRGPAAP